MTAKKVEVTAATETVALSIDPEFLELIRASRARQAKEGGLSAAEIRRRLKGERSTP